MSMLDDITAASQRQLAQIERQARSHHENIDLPNGRVLACGLSHPDHDTANAFRARLLAEQTTAAEARRQAAEPAPGWTHRGRTILTLQPRDGVLVATCAVFELAARRPNEPSRITVTLVDQAL
ncbi:MAG: hypothetical protein RL499_1637, partial [Actinomycetota bacterium]